MVDVQHTFLFFILLILKIYFYFIIFLLWIISLFVCEYVCNVDINLGELCDISLLLFLIKCDFLSTNVRKIFYFFLFVYYFLSLLLFHSSIYLFYYIRGDEWWGVWWGWRMYIFFVCVEHFHFVSTRVIYFKNFHSNFIYICWNVEMRNKITQKILTKLIQVILKLYIFIFWIGNIFFLLS